MLYLSEVANLIGGCTKVGYLSKVCAKSSALVSGFRWSYNLDFDYLSDFMELLSVRYFIKGLGNYALVNKCGSID